MQKLDHPRSHVDVVLLVLGSFLVEELVDGIVLRLKLKQDGHDDKECFAQVRRAAFATGLTAGNLVAGIVLDGIGARKAHQRLLVREVAQIADLDDQLWPHELPDAGHGHDGLVFGKLSGQAIHLGAVGFHRTRDGSELRDRFLHQQLAGVGFGNQRKLLPGVGVQLNGLLLGEIVAVTLAPLPVALHKDAPAETGDAVHMTEGIHEIDPLLVAVRAHRTVKVPVRAGTALLQQCNQVVVQRGSDPARQLELAVQGFEAVTNCIHGSILRQKLPLLFECVLQ